MKALRTLYLWLPSMPAALIVTALLPLSTHGYAEGQGLSSTTAPASGSSVTSDQKTAPVSNTKQTQEVFLSPAIKDVLKLVDAKVSPDVIKAYIKNYPYAYNPGANQIIVLKDHGASPEVLEALVQHTADTRSQAAQTAARDDREKAQPPPNAPATYQNPAQPPSGYNVYGDASVSSAPNYYPVYYPPSYNYWWYNYSYPWWASFTYFPSYGCWPYSGYNRYYGGWRYPGSFRYAHDYRGYGGYRHPYGGYSGAPRQAIYRSSPNMGRLPPQPSYGRGFSMARSGISPGFSGGQRFGGGMTGGSRGGGGGFHGGGGGGGFRGGHR